MTQLAGFFKTQIPGGVLDMSIQDIVERSALPHVKEIVPYPPGKPIEELEREWGVKGSIKLASNENPLGPSSKAVEAMKEAMTRMHRYPDGAGYYLRKKLSERTGRPFEGVMLGSGSNEIIDMAVRAFMTVGDVAVSPFPTFLMYSKFVAAVGGKLRETSLHSFRIDVDDLLNAVEPQTKLIFLCNPNNPTGVALSARELETLMEGVPSETIVIFDEAYVEFTQDPDIPNGLDYLDKYANMIVTRTFSKIYGLAGVRVGYGFAHPDLAAILNRVRQPFNVNALGQIGALAALDDEEFLRKTQNLVWEGLKFFYAELDKMGLEYVPTQANFFLVKVGPAKRVYEEMLKEGVIIRNMDSYGLHEYVRINVGLPEENSRCIKSLQKVMERIGQ